LDFLNRFLGYFTYRQRFLVAAAAYIIFAPYPTYVVIHTLKFWTRQFESQIEGDNIQKKLNGLLSSILIHQEYSAKKLIQKDAIDITHSLDDEISGYFTQLQQEQQNGGGGHFRLGSGFSTVNDAPIDIEPGFKAWRQLLNKEGEFSLVENLQTHQKIVDNLKNELFKLGYSYALFLGDNLPEESYSRLVLERLPELEDKIKELSIKSRLVVDQNNELGDLNYQIMALHEIARDDLSKIEIHFNVFYDSIKLQEGLTITSLQKLKKAFDTFFDTTKKFLNAVSDSESEITLNSRYFTEVVLAKNNLVHEMYHRQHHVYEKELRFNKAFYYSFLIQLSVLVFMAWFLVRFRGLSSHLTALRDHIYNLSRGQLSHCFTSKENDEFGNVGRALDKVVDVITIIINDLVSFSNQIQEITVRVAWAVREQEETLLEQEKIVVDGERTAQDIAKRSSFLSNLLTGMCESSQLIAQAENAHGEIKKMRENMNNLVQSYGHFVVTFDSFADKVQNTQKKVNFMDRLGEQAKMLSLNGKIENASIPNSLVNFSEITNKIGRFSDKSEEATSQIKQIIKEALTGVKSVKGEAQRCLNEISAGVEQLSLVSSQLEGVAKLGENQQLKFLKVDEMMKIQAVSSQKIIQTVQNLLKPATENATLVHQLPKILDEIVDQEKKLKEVISKMVYIS
jgi:methyl-accepting chemotaxis protein